MHFDQSLQIIRPKLPPEQQWYRDKYHKNWGVHIPLIFKNGKPNFILPSFPHISFIVLYFIVFLLINIITVKQICCKQEYMGGVVDQDIILLHKVYHFSTNLSLYSIKDIVNHAAILQGKLD